MTSTTTPLDASTLRSFEHAAAGHDGVLSDPSGELLIKPCTQAEIDFYQETQSQHPDFAEMMPTFMGTLTLGAPAIGPDATAAHEPENITHASQEQQVRHGAKIKTESAIVLENLEHTFRHANVLDVKLGARLYADGTESEKAARLDKVANETTSASLHFRIAGMKVWNGKDYDLYDKFYGRKFTAETVQNGFSTFFSGLGTALRPEEAQQLLETVLAEITKVRHMLEKYESRMFSASLLIVYEGDSEALDGNMGNEPKKARAEERHPTEKELSKSIEEEEEEDEDGGPPDVFKVRMIDFAHAAWTPEQGQDENVIKGLKNVEEQMDQLIARFD